MATRHADRSARAAAPGHRRLGRRRQVDADRPAAPGHQAAALRPAGRRLAGTRRRPGPGRAHRRPARRARAGHHHRRGLPLLRDAAPHLHPGRHARARALHPQHVHRRLDRGPGARPGRRPRRRRHPDAPSRPDRGAAAHSSRGGGDQQDGPGRVLPGAVRRGGRGHARAGPQHRAARAAAGPDQRPGRRQRRRPVVASRVVRRSAADRDPGDRRPRRRSRHRRGASAPADPVGGAPAGRRHGACTPDSSPPARCAPATRSWSSPPGPGPRSRRSERSIPTATWPSRRCRWASPSPTTSTSAAATCWPRPSNRPPAARELDATICWMSEEPLAPGRRYALKHTTPHGEDDRAGDPRPLGSRDARGVRRAQLARPQRHRAGEPAHELAGARRPVPAQRGHRRLHPHRRALQRHRRRGDHPRGARGQAGPGRPPRRHLASVGAGPRAPLARSGADREQPCG